MYILDSLNKFLCENASKENFQDVLEDFNKEVLINLNEANMLDDDASLGFVINQNVLDHYTQSRQ
jgi:hypothetical protein